MELLELPQLIQTPPKDPPPIQFIGLARDFIRRCAAEFAQCDPLLALPNNIKCRVTRHPKRKLRPEHIQDVIRQWQQQPSKFRLHFSTETKNKLTTIFEIRLIRGAISDPAWDDGDFREPTLAITNVLFNLDRAHYTKSVLTFLPSHIISLHALARRYERCSNTDDTSIITDLTALMNLQPLSDANGLPVTIPTTSGSWRGQYRNINDHISQQTLPVIAIRTFVANPKWE